MALTLLGKQPHPVGTVPPMPYTHQQMEEKSRDITAPKPASVCTNQFFLFPQSLKAATGIYSLVVKMGCQTNLNYQQGISG